ILPVYNADQYLRPALNSICRQTHENLEIIVIDDGSTDGSGAVLVDMALRDSRIRLFSQANCGLIRTLNSALDVARGELIARMDADDICLPTRIAEQVAAFAEEPELGLCGTTHHILFRPGWLLNPAFQELDTSDEQTAVRCLFQPPFVHPSAMFRGDLMRGPHAFRYDPAYPHAEDFELFRRISRGYRIRNLPRKLIAVRRHHESVMTRHSMAVRHTHYRILAENFAGFRSTLDFSPLIDLCATNGPALPEILTAAGRVLVALKATRGAFEPELLPAWDASFGYMVRHLIETADITNGPAGVALLLQAFPDGWTFIRRRDRAIIRAGAWLPRHSWRAIKAVELRMAKRTAGRVEHFIPNYADIAEPCRTV
ncbi:MAG: family 2 glycosyl transferase, partial [Hyphomicrobiales bacterium]|nr:family 2 glycosyl transferase [Hyphomicrobiales bacterium]